MKFTYCKYNHLQLAEQFLKIAEKFLPYVANESNVLNMGECNIIKHTCGTTACHGGYAALVLNVRTNWYEDGANALAKYLGFHNEADLSEWASEYPKYWGNDYGYSMFSSRNAFGISVHDEIKLEHIVKHYFLVAKNLMEIKE